MEVKHRSFLRGSLAMIASMIGAGVFGIPLAMKGAGILQGSIIYWLLALVMLSAHLLYAEVILRKTGLRKRRLPGQAHDVLGPWAGWIALVSHPFQIVGACLAYIILGGGFLAMLAGMLGLPQQLLLWQLLFWVLGAIVVYFGLKLIARIEFGLTWALVLLTVTTTGFFLSRADGGLFFTSTNHSSVFLAVGVFLFALSGLPVISEVVEIAGRERRIAMLSITGGTLAGAFLMWAFGVFAYAAIGPAIGTTATGLANGLPIAVAWLIPAVGFVAVGSSFIVLSEDLKAMLHLDLHVPKTVAWLMALGAPLALLVFITQDFLSTISFVGSIFGSVNGMLVALMAIKVRSNPGGGMMRYVIPCVVAMVFLSVFIWRILDLILF